MTIGVLGGGQLGRMLALAAVPLGERVRVIDPSADAPAGQVAELISARYEDPAGLERFAEGLSLVTYELESLPVDVVERIAKRLPVRPPPAALAIGQDRWEEKSLFARLSIPTPRFARIDARADLEQAIAEIGLPAVLKTRRFGYDGKGQVVLRTHDTSAASFELLGGRDLILEAFVPFDREVSVIAVRGSSGEVRYYDLVENVHRSGILRLSRVPASDEARAVEADAQSYIARILTELDYVGVLALELFQVGSKLFANEMAPRVHNSGHWTIEGAETSQFENHLRAILELPLGETSLLGPAAMINLIGSIPDRRAILAVEGAHLHAYGKQPAPGRKLGHVTVRAPSSAQLEARIAAIEASIG
jgi:5-(carboxyamino)imidazole ribonucleotide synthase